MSGGGTSYQPSTMGMGTVSPTPFKGVALADTWVLGPMSPPSSPLDWKEEREDVLSDTLKVQ